MGALGAEDLRTIVAGTILLSSENPEGGRATMAYNEALAVSLPRDSSFIQGFEIEIKTPQAYLALPNSLAYELWRRVDPAPDKNRYGYSGERIIVQPLPTRAGIVIQVPVRKDHSLKPSPYSTLLPVVVESRDFPFIFKLEPVSKGIPPELENAQFQVKVRPILTDEGGLRLSIRYPEGGEKAPVVVTVDDKRLPEGHYLDGKETFILKAGSHYVRVSSEKYRDENRTVSVEQGKTAELAIELQDTAPLVSIEAPDSAQLAIDGQKLGKDAKYPLPIEAGEHTVTCRIGDYVVMRKFTAFRGKSYKIVLSVDLQVQENP
jgi:hypothetical protein